MWNIVIIIFNQSVSTPPPFFMISHFFLENIPDIKYNFLSLSCGLQFCGTPIIF